MDIRKAYLDFFASKGHQVVPSAPLVPDDATLLFTNAGMVPFKSIFTGDVPRPTPPIRTSCQTCIRAGGKHNDLDNVGYTARHHTFFEMLGNFSFGEYFKRDAIAYAWEFVTEVLRLPKDRLYVTVHESDDEAFEMWRAHIAAERIYRFGDHDNFWQMGDTGPCGPCSEIFYDQGAEHFSGPEDYMGGDGDRFLEIWNLVFMQYERAADGTLSPLPKPSIDTGMGLERVTAIKEGKFSNYDSSLFMPLIDAVAGICGRPYEYESGASYRVIADHIRAVTFLLAQGVNFDKEGRGYVLRRILRRAVRHGWLLGIREPFMWRLVDTVAAQMGGHYEYLAAKKSAIAEMVKMEEERFLATIAAGLELFNAEISRVKDGVFSGETAFKLYDTYGFPLDLTQDMLRERDLKVDEARFDALMAEQKARAKASWKGSGDAAAQSGDFKGLLEEFGENEFIGYECMASESRVVALLDENFKRVESLGENLTHYRKDRQGAQAIARERADGPVTAASSEVQRSISQRECVKGWVFLDRTPFYAMSGGQCGDTGTIAGNAVSDTRKFFGLNLSEIRVQKPLKVGDIVACEVSLARLEIRRHHSATHLLHAALRAILGDHIAQAGSSVEAERLRFDFSHPRAVAAEEIAAIEAFVNAQIARGAAAKTELMEIEEAKKSGAIALFGEKYAERVRVLTLGCSKELCGGTHVEDISEIGGFFVVKESGVSAGVRRIEAVCSQAAVAYANALRTEAAAVRDALKGAEPLTAIKKLKDEIAALKSELKTASSAREIAVEQIGGVAVAVAEFDGDIKAKIDELKNKFEKIVIFLAASKDGKVQLGAGVKNADLKAGELVKKIAPIVGGGGGGRDDFATAGGKDTAKIAQALSEARKIIEAALN